MPSKVHTNANVNGLIGVFNSAMANTEWKFESTSASQLVELLEFTDFSPEGAGFLFALTAVDAHSQYGDSELNTLVFRNDVDGTQSHVQVIDRKGRRVKAFTAYEEGSVPEPGTPTHEARTRTAVANVGNQEVIKFAEEHKGEVWSKRVKGRGDNGSYYVHQRIIGTKDHAGVLLLRLERVDGNALKSQPPGFKSSIALNEFTKAYQLVLVEA